MYTYDSILHTYTPSIHTLVACIVVLVLVLVYTVCMAYVVVVYSIMGTSHDVYIHPLYVTWYTTSTHCALRASQRVW